MTRPAMTPQVQVGWTIIDRDGRYMFWPTDDLQEARQYCEVGASPVPIFAPVDELDKHEKDQGL